MPKYTVKAIELARTVYINIEADNPEQAVKKCQDGHVIYDSSSIVGDEGWVETMSVEEE